ncbi:TonB-dependent receptor SusC [termite gut metagenome]|uniref:TonB-dependent receptor SusC n=1 Tax=termite gut metagenome TaxID=433724 RepID=A0A5J4S971_9ZZZZ
MQRMSNQMKKNLRFGLLFMLLATISLGVSAQTVTLRGNVKDKTGEVIIGATVLDKANAGNGTVTGFDGNFTLTVSPNATVVISYIGMKTQEINVAGKNTLSVTLEDDVTVLDEVVAIGYGTTRRKDITGSVASVNADAIIAIPVASAVEAISGKLAGVQVTTTEGSPDAEVKIRVRGGGSITGDNTPLFIVDGFPVNSISDISPNDIESIDVLKDASSTAIYGSRGANGVIIVTTKSGKEGKVSVNYNAYISYKKIAKKLDVLSSYDYAKWQYERAMLADGKPDKYTGYFGNYQDMDMYQIEGNDWQEQTFGRVGFTFNHNLSISGGSEKTKYSFNYSHINDKAIMQMSGFKRDNLSLKLSNKPNKKVTLDFSLRYSDTEIEGGGANEQNEKSSADSRLRHAMIYPPFPVGSLIDNGDTDDSFNLYNPLVSLSDNDRFQERKTINMNGSVSWEIIKNMRIKTEIGLDDYRNVDNRFYGATTYYVRNIPSAANQGSPAIVFDKVSRESIRNTNTLNYDFQKWLPEHHHLNLLAGQEFVRTKQESHTTAVHGFPKSFGFAEATKLSAQGQANSIDNYLSPDNKLLSFFGRVNYDYQSKYLLSVTFRADGSSKFSEDNKWGYFPSAALAWRISSESFMENTKNWLDDMKLRLSYGTAGNNNIPSGQMSQTFDVKTTTWVNGFSSFWAGSKTMANPDLKWETTVTRNIGLDVTTWGGRLSGTLEAYLNNTKDLLIQFTTPGTGYDNQYRNMGETENKGLEASVNVIAIVRA